MLLAILVTNLTRNGDIFMRTSIIASAILATISTVSFADDLIITSTAAKGANLVSLDLLSSGSTAGVQINIPAAGGKVDLSGLSRKMSGSFTLQSSFDGKEIVLMLANDDNSALTKGQINLGTIRVSGVTLGTAKIIAVDAKAAEISSSVHSN
jgi:hypothetical protein